MTRLTSIGTYNDIKANGLLSKRRWEVYDVLYNMGPMTANEMVRYFQGVYPDRNSSGWNGRFSELERLGVVTNIGTRIDEISGHECILWDVTDKLPTKPEKKPKRPSKKELIQKIEELGHAVPSKWKPPLREIWSIANSI